MTRSEIKDAYHISERGIIISPGKFEGEMLWAPYFYDLMGDGSGEQFSFEEGHGIEFAKLIADDKKQWPELSDCYGISIEESSQGFVHCEVYDTKEQYDENFAEAVRLDNEYYAQGPE